MTEAKKTSRSTAGSSRRSAPKDVLVAVRISTEQAAVVDQVRQAEGLRSRGLAVRRMIELLSPQDIPQPDAAEGKEVLPPESVAAVLDALDERTRAYRELSKQVRAIGVQNNQLVKLGHMAVSYGKDAVIPVEAVQSFDRQIDEVREQLALIAGDDAHVELVVRSCRPSS